jgi:hypothetical protein
MAAPSQAMNLFQPKFMRTPRIDLLTQIEASAQLITQRTDNLCPAKLLFAAAIGIRRFPIALFVFAGSPFQLRQIVGGLMDRKRLVAVPCFRKSVAIRAFRGER